MQFRTTDISSQINLAFWSGNVYNCLCHAEFQNSLLTSKKALEILCSFHAIPSFSLKVYSLLGFDGRINKILLIELNQASSTCVLPTFGYDELYKVLAGPCVRILGRYDHQSVLQFLLMKLRTATDSAWLDNLPELRQVGFLRCNFVPFSICFQLRFLYCIRKSELYSIILVLNSKILFVLIMLSSFQTSHNCFHMLLFLKPHKSYLYAVFSC